MDATPKFIQPSVVIPAKALEKIVLKWPVLPRAVCELMPREMVEPIGNEHTLINMEGRRDALRENVGDVVVRVRAIVKFRTESSLPFLGGHLAARVRRMQQKAFKLQFPNAPDHRTRLERQIRLPLPS